MIFFSQGDKISPRNLFVTKDGGSTWVASCSAEGSPQTDDGREEKEEEAAGQCSPVDQLPLLTMAAFHPQFHLPHQADQLACPAPVVRRPSAVAARRLRHRTCSSPARRTVALTLNSKWGGGCTSAHNRTKHSTVVAQSKLEAFTLVLICQL